MTLQQTRTSILKCINEAHTGMLGGDTHQIFSITDLLIVSSRTHSRALTRFPSDWILSTPSSHAFQMPLERLWPQVQFEWTLYTLDVMPTRQASTCSMPVTSVGTAFITKVYSSRTCAPLCAMTQGAPKVSRRATWVPKQPPRR